MERSREAWVEMLRPLSDKFTLPAKVGCMVRLDADAAKAVGESVQLLGQVLDLCDDDRAACQRLIDALFRERKSLHRLTIGLAVLAALFALLWVLS